jgi:hypothetical protein
MRLGHETGHSPLPSAKVKNEHSCASTALFVCMASTRTTNSVMNNILIMPKIPICSNCNVPKTVLFSFQCLLGCDRTDRYQCTGEIRCSHYQHRHMNSSILKREAAHFPKTMIPMSLCWWMSQKETTIMTVRSVMFLKFTQFWLLLHERALNSMQENHESSFIFIWEGNKCNLLQGTILNSCTKDQHKYHSDSCPQLVLEVSTS